jgi:hypothetical protein
VPAVVAAAPHVDNLVAQWAHPAFWVVPLVVPVQLDRDLFLFRRVQEIHVLHVLLLLIVFPNV